MSQTDPIRKWNEFGQVLKAKRDTAYYRWRFLQEHGFEMEAIIVRRIYDIYEDLLVTMNDFEIKPSEEPPF